VLTTALQSDGGFDSLTPSAASLNIARQRHQAVVLGSSLYLLGGLVAPGDGGNDTATGTIERATIMPDGTLQSFSVASVQMMNARAGFGLAVVGGKLYVFGGYNGNTQVEAVEAAPIGDDGSLGAFSPALTPDGWPEGRDEITYANVGNHIYVFGGSRAGVEYAAVTSAQFDVASGQLLPFAVENLYLPEAFTQGGTAVVVENQIHVLGSKLYTASIDASGALGDFAATPSTVPAEAGIAVIGNRLVAIGGQNSDAVSDAVIAPDGNLGPFTSRTPLMRQRAGAALLVHEPYLYVIGGSADKSIERLTILADGSIASARELVTSTLIEARAHMSAFVDSGSVFLVGGVDPMTSTPRATVESAPLQGSGALGAFVTSTTLSLGSARGQHGGLFVDGSDMTSTVSRYFVVGGVGASGPLDSLEAAQLPANFQASGNLSAARAGLAALRVGDIVYAIGGGIAGSDALKVISPGMLGTPTAGPRLPASRSLGRAVVLRDFAWLLGGSVDRAPLQP
jgi:hypothetical protein